mgnify:CR=1 FL=1
MLGIPREIEGDQQGRPTNSVRGKIFSDPKYCGLATVSNLIGPGRGDCASHQNEILESGNSFSLLTGFVGTLRYQTPSPVITKVILRGEDRVLV